MLLYKEHHSGNNSGIEQNENLGVSTNVVNESL